MRQPKRATRRAKRPVELPVTKTLTGAEGTDSPGSQVPERGAEDHWSGIARSLRELVAEATQLRLDSAVMLAYVLKLGSKPRDE